MKKNISLKKQLEQEQDCLNFIKIWFKGMSSANVIAWLINLLLLTKFQIDFFIIPSILLTVGSTFCSIYMTTQYSKTKQNIKKINHKLYIEETNLLLEQQNQKEITNQKNLTNKKNQNYTQTNDYNNIHSYTANNQNNNPKKRILKRNK